MYHVGKAFAVLLLFAGAAFGTVFATVRGIVHDPQHRPLPNAQVVLKAKSSEYRQTTQTDPEGQFHFDAVPLGESTVEVSDAAFAPGRQGVTVFSPARSPYRCAGDSTIEMLPLRTPQVQMGRVLRSTEEIRPTDSVERKE
jgi:hypothetical protein